MSVQSLDWVFLGSAPGISYDRRSWSGSSSKSAFSPDLSGFCPWFLRILFQLLLSSTTTVIMLPSILTYGGTCLPNSMYSDALAHTAVPYQAYYLSHWHSEEALWRNRLEAFRYNIACLSRWLSREAPRWNCLDTTKLRVYSQFIIICIIQLLET